MGFQSAEQAKHFIKQVPMKPILFLCRSAIVLSHKKIIILKATGSDVALKKLYVCLSSHLNTIWNLPFTNLFTIYNPTVKYYNATLLMT